MDSLTALLEKYWIRKDKEREQYFSVKRDFNEFNKFIIDQLGWKLIINEKILKLEKLPAQAEAFMGIDSFSDIRDYCLLCGVLIFLEDKEDGYQFLLSELVGSVEIFVKDCIEIDWTKFTHRKSLIRVLQFAEKMGMLIVYEGESSALSDGMGHEVLYENSGLSRYFAIAYDRDISSYRNVKDFETAASQEQNVNRGYGRNRVYRKLVTGPAIYWHSNDDQDAMYLKNQRRLLQANFGKYLGGNLQINKNAAFLVFEDNEYAGSVYPNNTMLSELVLLLCGELRERLLNGSLIKNFDDSAAITKQQFRDIILICKEKTGSGWSKEYRELSETRLINDTVQYMKNWLLLAEEENNYIILPGAMKLLGRYPRNFKEKGGAANE